MENYTEDYGKFGYRERAIASDLIKALNNKKTPDDFELTGVRVGFNLMSGNVFLTNDMCQVCKIDDEGELYSYYTLMYTGAEGSFEDLLDDYENLHPEDQEELKDIAKNIGREEDIK